MTLNTVAGLKNYYHKLGRKSQIRLIVIVILVLVTLFLPGDFETMKNAYQTGLWTSNVYPPQKATGFTLKFGGDIGYSIEVWNRIRLGYPFKPVTIDIQLQYSIIQVRIEPDAIIVNVVFMSIVGFCVFLVLFCIEKLFRKALSNKSDPMQ